MLYVALAKQSCRAGVTCTCRLRFRAVTATQTSGARGRCSLLPLLPMGPRAYYCTSQVRPLRPRVSVFHASNWCQRLHSTVKRSYSPRAHLIYCLASSTASARGRTTPSGLVLFCARRHSPLPLTLPARCRHPKAASARKHPASGHIQPLLALLPPPRGRPAGARRRLPPVP